MTQWWPDPNRPELVRVDVDPRTKIKTETSRLDAKGVAGEVGKVSFEAYKGVPRSFPEKVAPDKLDEIFRLQRRLLVKAGKIGLAGTWKLDLNTLVLAATAELHEILDETNWKPWKLTQVPVDKAKVKEEFADLLHFVVEIAMYFGFTPVDVFGAYVDKHLVNVKRLEEGY